MSPTLPDFREKYRAHVRERFQILEDGSACHEAHVHLGEKYLKLIIARNQERQREVQSWRWRQAGTTLHQSVAVTTMAGLFGAGGDKPWTLVLQGVAGVGKTTLARMILFDWAVGRLFAGRFDCIFYISCRQVNLVTEQVSLADLICKMEPEFTHREAVRELLMDPSKLLFIIDGFDALTRSTEQWGDSLSVDPWERQPVGVLLSSLFSKALLPEASLIITTRPTALGSLENCLQSPRYVGLQGFSEEGREEYFHKFFGDEEQATWALQCVTGNEALSAVSLVPSICWIICTVLKQQLERDEKDLACVPATLTAVYVLYLCHLLESSSRNSEPQNLRSFCSLAAEGTRAKKAVFEEDQLQKHGVYPLDSSPASLFENLCRKDPDCEGFYSFIHLSLQEFLTALFYAFVPQSAAEAAERDIETLLERCKSDQGDLTLLRQFLFGLLNRERTECIGEQLGWKVSPTLKVDLLEWLKAGASIKVDDPSYDQLESFHSLYESQEEDFVKCALDHMTELRMESLKFTPWDQEVLSFCVKNCANLEALSLYGCSFLSKNHDTEVLPRLSNQSCQQHREIEKHSVLYLLCQALKDPNSKIKKLELCRCQLTDDCCADLATVLSINQMLVEMDLQINCIKDSGIHLLGKGLTHPNCKLEKLSLWECGLTQTCCGDLSAILCASQTLAELNLTDNCFQGEQGIQRLCEGLKYPNCKLLRLGLEGCGLPAANCQDLASVLSTNQTLRQLNLESNKLGDAGVKLLCEGLKHPKCKLQALLLSTCELTPACCWDLASVFSTNQALTELVLEHNNLEDSGMRLLCEGLKKPNCKLEKLDLENCGLTAAAGSDLSSVLTTSRTLRELNLEYNRVEDEGVKILCEGLKHSNCKMQTLGFFNCGLTAACCEDLACVLSSCPTLTEVTLGGNELGDLGVQLLCEGLKHPNCKLQELCLCESKITAASCGALSAVLSTNRMLRKLDLWNDKVEDSGMKLLCEGLKQPDCKLHILSIWNCGLTVGSCGDLSSVLSTNQNLKELLLDGNELGDAGVMLLCEGLKHPNCRLKKIGLDCGKLTDETVRQLHCLKKMKPDLIIDT